MACPRLPIVSAACLAPILVGALLPAAPPGRIAPGQAPSQTPTFRTGVQTVVVYATVRDAGGRLATDLPQDAFEVVDNGRPVRISVFSNEHQSITVALMLDMSGSMETKVLRVRESARSFVDALQPGDRAAIGTFGGEVAISPHLTGDSGVLSRVLSEELWPGGITPLWRAIDAAMASLSKEAGRRVVLVLTDGADTDVAPGAPSQGTVERRAIAGSFMIYAIGMEGSGLAPGIASVTEKTGGGHFELKTAAELPATFTQVVEELRHQYLLGFVPDAQDGRLHTLKVRGTRPGMEVRARTTYQARGDQ